MLTNRTKNDIINTNEGVCLEQAKKRTHKIYITDVSVAKVGRVNLSGFSELQIEHMQKKHQDLLRIAKEKNDSNEVLLINDLDFKSEVSVFGDEHIVSPGKNPFAVSVIARAEKQSLVYMHNHPSTNLFSVADIDTFICESGVKVITVVTNQGEVYALNKLDKYEYNKARELLLDIYESFSDKEFDDRDFVLEFLKRCKEGGIEYAKSK